MKYKHVEQPWEIDLTSMSKHFHIGLQSTVANQQHTCSPGAESLQHGDCHCQWRGWSFCSSIFEDCKEREVECSAKEKFYMHGQFLKKTYNFAKTQEQNLLHWMGDFPSILFSSTPTFKRIIVPLGNSSVLRSYLPYVKEEKTYFNKSITSIRQAEKKTP